MLTLLTILLSLNTLGAATASATVMAWADGLGRVSGSSILA